MSMHILEASVGLLRLR